MQAMVWDRENIVSDIRTLVISGRNTVVLRCRTENMNLERANNAPAIPAVLAGTFIVRGKTLHSQCNGILTGPLHEKGYPYFCGTAIYEMEFEWDTLNGGRVFLDLHRIGDVAEVFINGRSIGTRLWEPYLFDITGALKKKNSLRIEVTGGIGNLLPFGYTDQLVEQPVEYGLLSDPLILIEREIGQV